MMEHPLSGEGLDWCMVLLGTPDEKSAHIPHITLFGPYKSFEEALKMAEEFKTAYPDTPNVLVPLQSAAEPLRHLPIERKLS